MFKKPGSIIIAISFSLLMIFSFMNYQARASDVRFNPQIEIPNAGFTATSTIVTNNLIGNYIAAIYTWGVGFIAILAVVVMMFGGLMLITSGGNQERVQSAKGWIGASATGLVLALTSFTILYLVNPDLTEYGALEVTDAQISKQLETDLTTYDKSGSAVCKWSMTNTCPDRWLEKDSSYCAQRKDTVCCCPPYGGDWKYDHAGTPLDIRKQLDDASDELIKLMKCLRDNLPEGAGRISSISDNYGLSQCQNHYDPRGCQHSKDSCHYGGGKYEKSHAIDIGDEENVKLINEAAARCKDKIGFVLNEGTHIHISTKECPKN